MTNLVSVRTGLMGLARHEGYNNIWIIYNGPSGSSRISFVEIVEIELVYP
jgi:hypothetical protein